MPITPIRGRSFADRRNSRRPRRLVAIAVPSTRSTPALGQSPPLGVQELHPRAHVLAVVVKGPPAHEVAVHDARFVDVDAATDLQVELALGDGRHPPALDAAGP